ncbi:30S ribosomal protein S27ae [archaeon]|nr:MAG: 30S ribosomal protein S27ae [archaeon]
MKHKEIQQSKLLKNKPCSRCGEGTMMAQHKQADGKSRFYCGKCHLTVWE